MKRIILIFTIMIFLVLALASCGCEHEFTEANCTTPKTCTKCGAVEGDLAEHTYTTGKCTEPQKCTGCGKEKLGFDHTWNDAKCEENKICTVCSEVGELVEHYWIAPSCTAPRHCKLCKETDGEPLGHTPSEVYCDEKQICTRCKATIREPIEHSWNEATCTSPKICTICKKTEGTALKHEWELIDEVKPSCAYGSMTYFCPTCENTRTTPKAPTQEYHMCNPDGYCTVCNTQFNREKMTLESIVMEGGTVIHAGIFTSTEIKNKIYKTILSDDINIPIVDLNGDLSKIGTSTSTRTTMDFTYEDEKKQFSCKAETRIQGASSASLPKKNYSIRLVDETGAKKKVVFDSSWGKEHKYCMKANYVDYSQARNVVSGKIYGDIISTRNVNKDELSSLANGGAIDGFPIIVYNNGNFHGIYTMNIPKDKWMFGMDDSNLKNQAIMMAADWKKSNAFREEISTTNMGSSGWELEFASNEESTVDNDTSWVVTSMNNLIRFVMNNDGEAFKNGISEYADIDKCIDSMIYTFVMCADDNISKNILWATYDGKVWFSSVYDMDGTWGMKWNGEIAFNENTHKISNLANGGSDAGRSHDNYNLLWEKIYINFFDKVVSRYIELRQGALSYENIEQNFVSFFAMIPDVVRTAENKKWGSIPSNKVDHLSQILSFAKRRLLAMDQILK